VGSTTTNSNVSSCEHHSVLDELHCGSFRLLMYNEQSRIVSNHWQLSICRAPLLRGVCRRRSMCGLGVMDNDGLEKELRLGRAKRESDQTSAVSPQCLANGIKDPLCFVVGKAHFSSESEICFDR